MSIGITQTLCPLCAETFPDRLDAIDHIPHAHAEAVLAPELDPIRDSLRKTMSDRSTDEAMFHIEHIVADWFPPGSHTMRTHMPLTDSTAVDADLIVLSTFLGVVDAVVVEVEADRTSRNPDYLAVEIKVTPRWL